MLAVIAAMQFVVGARRLGRREAGGPGMSGRRTNMPPNAALGGAG
jgi:hypothetical protein